MIDVAQEERAAVVHRLVRVVQTHFGMEVTFVIGAGRDRSADVHVPLRFDDRTHGMLWCSRRQGQALRDGELEAVQALADLAAEQLEEIEQTERLARHRRKVVLDVVRNGLALEMAYQPLRHLHDGRVLAVEALARFPLHPGGPEWFFREAADQGLGVEAEVLAVRRAIDRLSEIPEPVRLNVNVSPTTLVHPRFLQEVSTVPAGRLTVEVTEHAVIEDYCDVQRVCAQLTALGIRTSIDDVGTGWSGLHRILECRPDELKLDAAVIRDVHREPLKQYLIETLCGFARRAGADVVAEGIESADELRALRELGIMVGQGYHLGRPGDLEALFTPLPVSRHPACG